MDIVPSLLFYKDLPLDKEMDGIVQEDIYEPEFFRSKKIRYQEIQSKKEEGEFIEEVYSHQEAQSIKKALKDLGYM